ncbi:MAG: ATP-dependent DNA ligase, partial [Gemmatimonadales bacterium]|nr:ATP-dependent DNA ligase [Gemmatimonadales bacterium]
MLLADLVATSAGVGATRARREKIARLAALLRRLDPAEIEVAVSYLSGELPQGRIGVGWARLRDLASGPAPEAPALSLLDVDAALGNLRSTTGSGSASERRHLLAALFGRTTAAERDFLTRLLLGEVRQGALAGLMTEALAAAAEVPPADVRRAALFAGDLRAVARAALLEGLPGLAQFRLQLLRPLQPMLAQPADDLDAALDGLDEAAVEWKLDGARVQIHKDGSEVRIFSRRLNDVTAAVPELVESVGSLPIRSLLLDGETIALRSDGSPLAFRDTMRRFGSRLEVEALRRELPLSAFFFDLLHIEGRDLLDQPAAERFTVL